jgi:hypothetical protein
MARQRRGALVQDRTIPAWSPLPNIKISAAYVVSIAQMCKHIINEAARPYPRTRHINSGFCSKCKNLSRVAYHVPRPRTSTLSTQKLCDYGPSLCARKITRRAGRVAPHRDASTSTRGRKRTSHAWSGMNWSCASDGSLCLLVSS